MNEIFFETLRRVEEARRNVAVHLEHLTRDFPFMAWEAWSSRRFDINNPRDVDELFRGWERWAPVIDREFDADNVAGWIITPQDILDYMNRVDWYAERLKIDIESFPNVPADLRASFDSWWIVWREFYAEHESWWSRQFSSVYDEVEIKEREVKELRARLIKAGGSSSTPTPEGPAVDPPSPPVTQYAGAAIGVAAAVALVVYVASRR